MVGHHVVWRGRPGYKVNCKWHNSLTCKTTASRNREAPGEGKHLEVVTLLPSPASWKENIWKSQQNTAVATEIQAVALLPPDVVHSWHFYALSQISPNLWLRINANLYTTSKTECSYNGFHKAAWLFLPDFLKHLAFPDVCHFDVSLWSLIRRFSPLSPLCLLPLNKRFSFWKCGKATSSRTSGIFALNITVSNACKWSWRCKPSLPSWCEASEWGEGLAVALAKCGFSPDWEERKQAGEKPYHVVMFVSLVKQDIPSQFTC